MNVSGLWNRNWTVVTKVVTACLMCVFAWGVVFYTDGPIKPCDSGQFCGKSKRHYSEQEYRAFLRWQAIMIAAGVAGAICRLVEMGLEKDREKLAAERQQARVDRANAQDELA